MPPKYHIHTEPAPPRVQPVGKLGIVEWREDCSNCHNCVKRSCVYGFYRDEADRLHNQTGYLDYIYQCKGCLSCVQNCTKGILTRVVNAEYDRLGDDYYTPEVILSTWYQAETGRIPVSGAGYGGRLTRPRVGFVGGREAGNRPPARRGRRLPAGRARGSPRSARRSALSASLGSLPPAGRPEP